MRQLGEIVASSIISLSPVLSGSSHPSARARLSTLSADFGFDFGMDSNRTIPVLLSKYVDNRGQTCSLHSSKHESGTRKLQETQNVVTYVVMGGCGEPKFKSYLLLLRIHSKQLEEF
jgi:hypothetical protein